METYITKQRRGEYLILELHSLHSTNDNSTNDTGNISRLLAIYPAWNKEVMYISDVNTDPKYMNHGYASQLIRRALWEARRNCCLYVKLDDCSDGFGKEHNIYVKNGFTYDRDGLPEMTYLLKSE